MDHRQISVCAITALTAHPRNARKHGRAQIRAIAKSIETFGFNAPILVDRNRQILAGNGRWEAAKIAGLTHVPVVFLDHLSEAQANAYMLADNKLTDRSSWDEVQLALHLKELSDLVLDFDIETTGFEPAEIDLRIQSLEEAEDAEKADEFDLAVGPAVAALGDLWLLGSHRLYCGSSIEESAYRNLFEAEKAAASFTDPPYNVKIDGHVSGNGDIKHREFPMAAGEMSPAEFTNFLTSGLSFICANTIPGALIYAFMDWRHLVEMLTASRTSGCDLINMCVWVKSNGGMGALYRSRHELIFVLRNGTARTLTMSSLVGLGAIAPTFGTTKEPIHSPARARSGA